MAPLRIPREIAHRGASGSAPENTLASFRRARELGATWVECDVMLAGDAHPVVIHDHKLERTTTGRGLVSRTHLSEIESLRVRSHHIGADEHHRVPTLALALTHIAALGMGLNLEIKPNALVHRVEPPRHWQAHTAERVIDEIRQHWPLAELPLLVGSFHPGVLAAARRLEPDIPRGFKIVRAGHGLARGWRRTLDDIEAVTVDFDHRFAGARQIREFRASGRALLSFTVNRRGHARRLFDQGVDSIFTDWPGLTKGMRLSPMRSLRGTPESRR